MSKIIKNKVGDLMIGCWESIAIMLDNFITGVCESVNLQNNDIIRKNLREISIRHMPFFDKIDEMKKAVSELKDITEETKEKLLGELDHIAKQGYEVKQGMEEVRRSFSESGLSRQDIQRIEKEIKRCEESVSNLYSITIPPYAYKNFMTYTRMQGAQNDITVMELNNGQYIAFYPAQHKAGMENALEMATLSYQQHPSVGAVERSAYFGAMDRSQAAILKFENLPAELAEKAVQEANFNSYVNFAKEEIHGSNPPLFNLICEAGETQQERNRNYQVAIEILAKSALAISGPLKELEEKKMRFEARKFAELTAGLESGSGYVFSIRDEEGKGIYNPSHFVRFETDKVNGNGQFFVNVNGVVTTTLYESETDRYKDQLYHMSQAGSGAKLYISDQEMDDMKFIATRLYNQMQSMTQSLDSLEFKELSVTKRYEAHNFEAQGQMVLYQAAKQESREAEMLSRACHLTRKKSNELTKQDILNGIISEHMSYNTFRARVKSDIAKNGLIIQKMARWNIKDLRNEAVGLAENKLRVEARNGHEDFSIPAIRIMQELDRFSVDKFIISEYEKAEADSEQGDTSELTISDVQKELAVLNEHYPKTLEAAKELFEDVRVRMVSIDIPVEMRELESPYTKSNHLQRNKLIDSIEYGSDVEEQKFVQEQIRTEATHELQPEQTR